MFKPLFHRLPWGRPTTTLGVSGTHHGVCPPAMGVELGAGSLWQRAMAWLLAPAPQDAATPASLSRLPRVRQEFLDAVADVHTPGADAVRLRIEDARSLRELWHARTEVYRVVALSHSQYMAEQRLARLNTHFPTRAPRSQFAPL